MIREEEKVVIISLTPYYKRINNDLIDLALKYYYYRYFTPSNKNVNSPTHYVINK